MIEYIPTQAEIPEAEGYSVCAIGLGGAGANALDRLALDGAGEAELICMNADIRALTNSLAPTKIQLGKNLTQGLGAGGDPELGLEAATSSEDEIRAAVAGRDMVFLCVGLGGGTGSGAAPLVARIARASGAFVVVFAIMPFKFEGRRRRAQADAALQELSGIASALVTFENSRMGELVLPKEGIQGAFAAADEVIGQSVRAVTSIILRPGLIRIGMDDIITALRNLDSRCLFGYGQAKGENRAQEALSRALKSPLLEKGALLGKAKNVLVHVAGGKTMTLFEIELLMTELEKHVHDDAQILFGSAVDNKLGAELAVTIISSLGEPEDEVLAEPVKESVTQPAKETAAAAPDAVADPPAPEAPPKAVPKVAAEEKVTAESLLELDLDDEPTPVVKAAPVPQKSPAVEPEPVLDDASPIVADLEEESLFDEPAPVVEPEEEPEIAEVTSAAEPDREPEVAAEVAAVADLEEEPEFEAIPTADGGGEDETDDTTVEAVDEPDVEVEEYREPEPASSKVIHLDPAVRFPSDGREESREEPVPEPAFEHHPGEDFRPFEPGEPAVAAVDEPFDALPTGAPPGFQDEREERVPQPVAATSEDSETQRRSRLRASGKPSGSQGLLELDPAGARGRFEKSSRTIVNGEDLDVPTFLRKRGR